MLRIVALATTLSLAAATSALAAQDDRWESTNLSMSDALDASFEIVDTYFDSHSKLVFVMQRDSTALLCAFDKLTLVQCAELNGDD